MLASVGSVPFTVVLIVFVPSPSGSYICFLFLLPVLPDIFFHDHYPLLRAIVAALWAFALAPPRPPLQEAIAGGGSSRTSSMGSNPTAAGTSALPRQCPRGGLPRWRRETTGRRRPRGPRTCTGPGAAAPRGRGRRGRQRTHRCARGLPRWRRDAGGAEVVDACAPLRGLPRRTR